ncbi:glycosyltransferase [Fuerstiella marisgermanici]|uniref:Teichuronic acid biosynthesis glycosyltransferase TuaH n=1 Tax=Fuerstiella marisgermanici TaxID=1891926 RepID=A0A1P8WI48_9PLAN|nr:glycosyltransferase [Fuerstiella marisgermanici]APZ93707.1 Putative teichuronic acid biosynthesis glycosyltransferase TuaH [Fuerstiella marisgermanici]
MPDRQATQPASLVVFSDDWGRHPSSCQHLIKQLLPSYKVLWVNTIGTRAPRLDMATLRRVTEKLKQWKSNRGEVASDLGGSPQHGNLTVVNPRMWPWFTRSVDRKINASMLSRSLTPLIKALPQPVSAITTLPITSDLPGRLPVDHWLYYCVDDFGEWPGLDGNTLRDMDVQMIKKADSIVAVSEHLQKMIRGHGRESALLTHGVDLNFWKATSIAEAAPPAIGAFNGPLAVFWGVVDPRLDTPMLTTLSKRMKDGTIVLAGPQQNPDDAILKLPNVRAIGSQPFEDLPKIAQAADVLIMPYADLPVTRAMQPLKMKEYIATGKPVVTSNLPSVQEWRDCMDVAAIDTEFADAVLRRISEGLPTSQAQARQRLCHESWAAKAQTIEQHINRLSTSEELHLA